MLRTTDRYEYIVLAVLASHALFQAIVKENDEDDFDESESEEDDLYLKRVKVVFYVDINNNMHN